MEAGASHPRGLALPEVHEEKREAMRAALLLFLAACGPPEAGERIGGRIIDRPPMCNTFSDKCVLCGCYIFERCAVGPTRVSCFMLAGQ